MNENPLENKEKLAIRVEIAKSEDWQACKELRLLSITGEDAKMFGQTPEEVQAQINKSEQEWRKETASDEMFSVLAWNSSEPVGLGRVNKVEGMWRIRNGYVKPEFRNMGIQQKIIALRLQEIKKRGGTKVRTGIKINNPTSLHVAEKFGFKVIKTDESWYIMESDLTNPEVIKKIDEALNAG
mgnify:CR=1 FL=1